MKSRRYSSNGGGYEQDKLVFQTLILPKCDTVPGLLARLYRCIDMAIDSKKIEQIAHLARLEIDAADVPLYVSNLNNILELVEQMQSVDTKGVLPMAHPVHASQRLRADEVTEKNQRELFLQQAPVTEEGLFLVPKVLD